MQSSPRIIAIGDLNGSYEVLLRILQGLKLIDRKKRWKARGTHLIQVGDLFNRGGGAREALALLMQLQEQAPAMKSKVTVLLGNHEVMTALGNEAYCDEAEYLSFATEAARRAWPARVHKAMFAIYRDHAPGGPILPLTPRLEAWKAQNAPGRLAMRRAMGPRGSVGRVLRRLPIVAIDGDMVFVHGGILPRWAKLGADGLNDAGAEAFANAPDFYGDLDKANLLRSTNGPLWNRSLVKSNTLRSRAQLMRSLSHLGVRRMVVGHTMTRALEGGKHGEIKLMQQGKLVCIDVGLGRDEETCAALVVTEGLGQEWTPSKTRRLWGRQAT